MLILSIAVAYLMIKVIKLDRNQIISLAELKERYWLRLVIIYSLIGFQILNFNQKILCYNIWTNSIYEYSRCKPRQKINKENRRR